MASQRMHQPSWKSETAKLKSASTINQHHEDREDKTVSFERDDYESSLPECALRKAAAPVLFDCQSELRRVRQCARRNGHRHGVSLRLARRAATARSAGRGRYARPNQHETQPPVHPLAGFAPLARKRQQQDSQSYEREFASRPVVWLICRYLCGHLERERDIADRLVGRQAPRSGRLLRPARCTEGCCCA